MPRIGITAYDLLISCPSDVIKYVDIIKDCVDSFNRTIGEVNNCEIVTKHWSTDSFPQSGNKPQELLNNQFVRECDAAVAIFWTRFGTPTDKYGSGTEEEIEEMLSSQKQVFMYFLDEPTNPSNIDQEQYKKVIEFREKYQNLGIYEVIKDEAEFRKKFTNHLTMYFLKLISESITASSEKRLTPNLTIKDALLNDNLKYSFRKKRFSKDPFIQNKKASIKEKIIELNKNFLAPREPSTNKLEIASSETTTDTNQLIQIENFLTKSLCDLEISEDWRKVIYEFSANNDIIIDSQFWNVGELKKGISIIPSYLGGGSSLNGTDDEINRYEEIEDLYYSIIEYNEYIDYFCEIDTYKKLDLVLSNIGDTFDEDIDIKICVAKNSIITFQDIAIPEYSIISDVLSNNFIDAAFKVRPTENIEKYSDYPEAAPMITTPYPKDIFYQKNVEEEYEEYIETYKGELETIFCYDIYEKDENTILKFHINYLKHNTSIAFPSTLLFSRNPEIIRYEITSKYTPKIIRGKIQIIDNC